jgi:hypothetical protein
LKELGESYADEQILMVLDNGPSHLGAAELRCHTT